MKTLNDGKTMAESNVYPVCKTDRSVFKRFTLTEGRLTLSACVVALDQDLLVLLFGGSTHVGAVATATWRGEDLYSYTLPGHKETDIANRQAKRLAAVLRKNVTVVCGIHMDNISKEEILSAEKLCEQAADRIAEKGG